MSFITKKLEEFRKKSTLKDGVKTITADEYYDIQRYQEVMFSTALDEMIKEVENGLPKEDYCNRIISKETKIARVNGYNACLAEIKQSLSSLREGNK